MCIYVECIDNWCPVNPVDSSGGSTTTESFKTESILGKRLDRKSKQFEPDKLKEINCAKHVVLQATTKRDDGYGAIPLRTHLQACIGGRHIFGTDFSESLDHVHAQITLRQLCSFALFC